jgi:CarD family transcriptional regulator
MIANVRYNACPSDGGEEHCLTSAATFEVGEVMVFGSEGFARVEAVGEKAALGRTLVFIDLFVFDANMRVSVPVERALERGLRPIAGADEIEGVLDSLQEARWTSIPWNRDGRLVKERYAEGGLEAILDTLGSLVELAGTKKLNDAQRTLLDRARRALVLETSAALGIDEAEAGERVDALLGAIA